MPAPSAARFFAVGSATSDNEEQKQGNRFLGSPDTNTGEPFSVLDSEVPSHIFGLMTAMEQLFCREYLVDFNATQAAIRSKYNPNRARQTASELLDKPHIQAEIKRTVGAVMARAEIDAAEVLTMIKSMAMVDPEDIFTDLGYMKPLSLIPKPARLCISSIKNSRYGSSVQLEGRLKALDLLGKYLKLWQDGININTGAGDEPMTVVFDFTGNTRGPGEPEEPTPEPEPPADKHEHMFD